MSAQIGAIAKPKEIRFTDALPKTRSGKIMRRLLRNIATGEEQVGDTSTLEDYSVLARLARVGRGLVEAVRVVAGSAPRSASMAWLRPSGYAARRSETEG